MEVGLLPRNCFDGAASDGSIDLVFLRSVVVDFFDGGFAAGHFEDFGGSVGTDAATDTLIVDFGGRHEKGLI